MTNPFDRFDEPQNPFDKFGPPKARGPIRQHIGDANLREAVMGTPSSPRVMTAIPQGANSYLADLVNAPLDYSGRIAQWMGLVPKGTPLPSEQIQDLGRSARARMGIDYTPNITPETKEEQTAYDIGRTGAAVATTVLPAAGVASMMGPAPSVAKGVAQTLTTAPGVQLSSGVVGDVVRNETGNPWLGMLASFGVPLGANVINRIGHAAPPANDAEAARRDLLAAAKKAGILPTAGTITNNYPLRMGESVLSKALPFGDTVGTINKNNQTALTKAFLDKIPQVRGENINAMPKATAERIGERIGRQFQNLADDTFVRWDSKVARDLAKAEEGLNQQLRSQIPDAIQKKLTELRSPPPNLPMEKGAELGMTGEMYKNIRSKLSAMLPGLPGNDKQTVGAMIDALDGAVQRSLPKDMVQDWQNARTGWRRFSMLRGAIESRHGHDTNIGIIPPGGVAARAGSDKEMSRLAEIGTSFVGDKMPDSGTGLRNFIMQLPALAGAGAGGAINLPATAGVMGSGYLANVAINNPYMRRFLIDRLANPTETAVPLGTMGAMAGQQLLAR